MTDDEDVMTVVLVLMLVLELPFVVMFPYERFRKKEKW